MIIQPRSGQGIICDTSNHCIIHIPAYDVKYGTDILLLNILAREVDAVAYINITDAMSTTAGKHSFSVATFPYVCTECIAQV